MDDEAQLRQLYEDAYSAETASLDVSVAGETALMVGRSRVAAAAFGGGKRTWPLQIAFQAKKNDDGWRLTRAEASNW